MCGILGFLTDKPSVENARYFKRILFLSESRGAEATGISYVYKGKPIIEKEPISATDFIKTKMGKHMDNLAKAKVAIGHTRFPTIGTPKDNNNNHPIESDNWILVHNGSVSALSRIDKYPYKGKVDSEVLLSYVEVHGIEKGLPYTGRGTASVALINKNELDAVYLWKEVNPLVLAYDEETKVIFFASQSEFLEKSLTNKMALFSSFQRTTLPENLLVKISVNPLSVEKLGYYPVIKTSNTTTYNWGWNKRKEEEEEKKKNEHINIGEFAFNKDSFRWQHTGLTAANTSLITSNTPALIPEVERVKENLNKAMLARGFALDEISRMTETAKATIIHANFRSSDVVIDKDGFIVPQTKELYERAQKINQYIITKKKEETKKEEEEEGKEQWPLSNKYFLDGMSHDFVFWTKLSHPNKGYISGDQLLIKKWSKERNSHYVVLTDDAITEKLIDADALEEDLLLMETDLEESQEIDGEMIAHMDAI